MRCVPRFLACQVAVCVALLLWWDTAQAGGDPRRAAVLPVVSVGVSTSGAEQQRARLTEILERRHELSVVEPGRVTKAVQTLCGDAARWWECLERSETLQELGRRLDVSIVASGRVAAIGTAHSMRLALADMATGAVSMQTLELPLTDDTNLLTGFVSVPRAAGREAQPWYKKWHYWTIAGVGVAAIVAVAVTVSLTADGSSDPWDRRESLP